MFHFPDKEIKTLEMLLFQKQRKQWPGLKTKVNAFFLLLAKNADKVTVGRVFQ